MSFACALSSASTVTNGSKKRTPENGGPDDQIVSCYSVGNQLSRVGPIDGIGVTGGIVGVGDDRGVARFFAARFLAAGRRRVAFARVRPRARLALPRLAARFLFATLLSPLEDLEVPTFIGAFHQADPVSFWEVLLLEAEGYVVELNVVLPLLRY